MVSVKRKRLDKPRLTETTLNEHGIFYNKRVYRKSEASGPNGLPKHVDNLKKLLLEFLQTIHPDYRERVVVPGQEEPPDYAWRPKKAVGQGEKYANVIAEVETEHSIEAADRFAQMTNSHEAEITQVLLEYIFRQFSRPKFPTA